MQGPGIVLPSSAAVQVQVARFEHPVSLRALSEQPAWQGSEVWDTGRMCIPLTEEQWDAVIDLSQQAPLLQQCLDTHVR